MPTPVYDDVETEGLRPIEFLVLLVPYATISGGIIGVAVASIMHLLWLFVKHLRPNDEVT